MEEPSVLDYLKSLINPFHREKVEIPKAKIEIQIPWRMLLAFGLALVAQLLLEPPNRAYQLPLGLYLASALMLVWSVRGHEFDLMKSGEEKEEPLSIKTNPLMLLLGAVLILLTFLLFGPDESGKILFTKFNVFVWLVAIGYFVFVFWEPIRNASSTALWKRISAFLRNPGIHFTITPWSILILASILLAIFFRFYRLDQVPGEMFSDHAEKLLDVSDVLNGQTSVFFERNTGREAIQMYLTAIVALLAKTGLSFMSLKIGTALAGLLTLPYIYFLGKEVGNRWVGILAFLLAAVAYWPNVISRVGLRFPLYPLFVAPVLYYVVHGLRNQNRNSFILAGIALGLGVHGYSPFRLVPVVVVAAVGLYILHTRSRTKRMQAVWALLVVALLAFVVFLPLFRYSLHNPDMFWLRALSRSSTTEQTYPEPVWAIFFSNLWKAWIMFFWDNGGIWVHSIVGRPALDVVTACLYFIGSVLLVIRYIRRRNWLDLFLLFSVPLLMMPSILSLAFPGENPSLNRTGGAIIPVFIIAALGFEAVFSNLLRKANRGWLRTVMIIFGIGLFAWTALANFHLVFVKFDQQFMAGAWNTSDIGRIIRDFSEMTGTSDTAYVVPFPHWVDTRLVGINAGFPTKDFALWPDSFAGTTTEMRSKLFIVKGDDQEDLAKLRVLYPQGGYWLFQARYPGKDFWVYTVPSAPGEMVR